MKKKYLVALVVISVLTLKSCTNNIDESINNEQLDQVDHEESPESIELNNGEKWKVNEEMVPYIIDAEQILKDYIDSQSTNFLQLAEQLKDKNKGLIQSCTMTGKSHDELHKWLHPHILLINKLGKSENIEEASIVISDLENSFETYHNFFQ
jgi:hypothetical protein